MISKNRALPAIPQNDWKIRDNFDLKLSELNAAQLFQLNAENMEELYALVGSTQASSCFNNSQGFYSRINHCYPASILKPNLKFALLNTVFKFNIFPNLKENIATILQSYSEDNLPFTCWVNTQDKKVDEIENILTQYDMRVETLLNCVAIECAAGNVAIKLPQDVKVVQVSKAAQLRDWIIPIQTNYAIHDWEAEVFIRIYSELLPITNNIKHYVAYHEGKPVAASTLFLGKKTAGLYNRASTIPPIAGKNIACDLMIRNELKFAYQQGYRIAVSQTQPRIAKIVARLLGFITCGQYKLFMGWKNKQ